MLLTFTICTIDKHPLHKNLDEHLLIVFEEITVLLFTHENQNDRTEFASFKDRLKNLRNQSRTRLWLRDILNTHTH